MDDLEKVQGRVAMFLYNNSHLSYPIRTSGLNRPALECRRMRMDMIDTFKILSITLTEKLLFFSDSTFLSTWNMD